MLVLGGHNMTDLVGHSIAEQADQDTMDRVVRRTLVLVARVMLVQAAPVIQDRGELVTTARGFADNLLKSLDQENEISSIKFLRNRFCQPYKYWLGR